MLTLGAGLLVHCLCLTADALLMRRLAHSAGGLRGGHGQTLHLAHGASLNTRCLHSLSGAHVRLAGNLARWALLARLTGYRASHFFSFLIC